MTTDTNVYRLIFALIRYHYKIPNPEDLPEERVMMLYQDLLWVKKLEGKQIPNINTPSK